jgi:hypothetical protein
LTIDHIIAEAERLARELELIKKEGDKQATLMVEEVKSRSVTAQRLIENRLKEESEAARRLTLKNRELEAAVRDLADEKAVYAALFEKTTQEKEQLQEELTEARSEVVQLTEQTSNHAMAVANALNLSTMSRVSAQEEYKGDYVDAIISGGSRSHPFGKDRQIDLNESF